MIDAAPPPAQHVLDAAHVYLERAELTPRLRAVVGGVEPAPFGRAGAGAVVRLATGETRLAPSTAAALESLWRARAMGADEIEMRGARVALHEQLHLYAPRAPEGIVDAVAVDRAREFADRYTGRAWRVPYVVPAYVEEVRQVRALSAAACGTGWRSACARAAREAILRWEAAT